MSPSGGKPELIFEAGDGESAYHAQILPGGDALLVTMGPVAVEGNTDLIENPRIVWQSLSSRERTTLIERGADARYIPTGHIVYADGGALLAVRFDLQRRQIIGDAVPLVEGVRRSNATPASQFSVSTNGSLAYLPGSSAEGWGLALLDRQGGSEVLKLRSATYSGPRVSPRGTEVAVEIVDGSARHIWIYDLSGKLAIRQLTLAGENRFPVWSADGERVAFSSTRGGDTGIWLQRADGRGAAERLTQPDKGTIHTPLSWHPREPTLLYFVRGATRNSTLWTYSLADKKSAPFAGVESQQLLSAQFSPDGRWVAYHTAERPGGSRGQTVFVRPYPSTDATVHPVGAGYHPHWSPDGSELFFARAGSLFVTRITTQPSFATSVPTAVPTSVWIPDPSRNFDITPDGKRFVTVVASASDAKESNVPRVEVVLNWTQELKRLVPSR